MRPYGPLNGNLRWDTLHRSEHVVFRPTETTNQPSHHQTFNPDTDWPMLDIQPDFKGKGDRIQTEDLAFIK